MTRHSSLKPLASCLLGYSLRALYLLHFVPWHLSLLTSGVSANSLIYLQSLLASELSSWAPVASWEHQAIGAFMHSNLFHSGYLSEGLLWTSAGFHCRGRRRMKGQGPAVQLLYLMWEWQKQPKISGVPTRGMPIFFFTSISELNHLHTIGILV